MCVRIFCTSTSVGRYFSGPTANLVAETGGDNGQLSLLVETICRDFRRHDVEELKTLAEWHRQTGCQNNRKTFTPREVTAIGDWLGAP